MLFVTAMIVSPIANAGAVQVIREEVATAAAVSSVVPKRHRDVARKFRPVSVTRVPPAGAPMNGDEESIDTETAIRKQSQCQQINTKKGRETRRYSNRSRVTCNKISEIFTQIDIPS